METFRLGGMADPDSEGSSVGNFSDPNEFSENGSWSESNYDPCNQHAPDLAKNTEWTFH